MQIVIDIDEVFYEALRETDEIISGQRSGKTLMSVIYNAVANGTPLPKGKQMKVEINGKTYCVETLIFDNERLRKEVVASAELHKSIFDNLRAEIADMPKLYPFIDHIDTYVK